VEIYYSVNEQRRKKVPRYNQRFKKKENSKRRRNNGAWCQGSHKTVSQFKVYDETDKGKTNAGYAKATGTWL